MRASVTAAVALLGLTIPGRALAQSAPATAQAADNAASEAAAPGVALEEPRPSQGHFVALGLYGIGAMAFDEDRGTRRPTFGQGLSLRLGEAVTDWLSLSLAFGFGTTQGRQRDKLTQVQFGFTGQLYFSERCSARAGFGALNVQGPDPENHGLSRGRYGDAYLAGVGYDFYLSERTQSGGWVLTPLVTAQVAPDKNFTATSLWLGVEIAWFKGLSRDKLNLPVPSAYSK